MHALVNANHNSRLMSENFMFGYKLLQIRRCKLRISIYAHLLTHVHVQSCFLNLPIQLIQPPHVHSLTKL